MFPNLYLKGGRKMYRIMPKSKNTLTTTIVGEWLISEDLRKDVDLEMRLFQCAFRTAFNRLLSGISISDVEKLVASMFNINLRYAKDAVMQAISLISSQNELLKQHLSEKERDILRLQKLFAISK
jgi:predicted transposase